MLNPIRWMFPARGPKIFNKLLLLLAMAGPLYGQNTTRMNSGVNAQTVSPYTVVCSDALKLVTLNSASAFAVNLPSAATCGAGYVFQLKNLGAGLVTITPLFGTIDGSSSITLSTGSGIDVYNNGTNYFTQSGSSTGSMDSILAGLAFQKNTFNSGQVSIYNGNFETGPTWGALTDTGPLPNPAWGNPIAGSQAIPGWLWSSGNLLCVTPSYETTTQYPNKNRSLKQIFNSCGTGGGALNQSFWQVQPGDTYYIRASMKTSGITGYACVRFIDKTTTGSPGVFPGDGSVCATTSSASWVTVSATGTVPANMVYGILNLFFPPSGPAGTVWYDNIQVFRVDHSAGQTIYDGASSGSAALGAASVAGTPNRINLPTITGTNGQCLQTDGANPQQASWGTCGVAGSNTQVQFNDSAVFGATADFTFTKGTGQVNIGSAGGKTGTVKLTGITSGSATIGVADAAGTPNKVLLPTTTGTSGYLLQTDGGNPQQLSWVSNGVGGLMTTLGDMIYENASPAAARLAGPTTPNSVAQILTNTPSAGAAATPVWALPGVPTNAQTGTTYTIAVTDRASNVTFSNAGAIAVTLPSAASAGFGSNFVVVACDIGAGTATITPTTSTISYSTGSAYTAAASSLALTTGQCAWIYSDNTNYFAIQRTGGAPVYPVSVSGTVTSGGIPYFNSTTQSSSSAILNTNILVKGGGAGGAPTNSSITDNGTTISTAEAISTTSTVSTGSSAPACTAGTSGLICMTEGTDGTNVASTGLINPNSTQHEFTAFTNGATGASSQGMLVRTQPGRIHSAGNTAAISTATLCASAAGACTTAGLYTVDWAFTQGGTACGNVTAGGVTFLLTWTD